MTISYLKHHFLIAMPILKGSFFEKTVIYLYEHTEEGAAGLMINKPLQINLGNVLRVLHIKHPPEIETQPVFMGGPVDQEQGFILHDAFPQSTKKAGKNKGIIISPSKEILVKIAEGAGPENYLITLGYAGWGPGQLESEIQRNDWLVTPFDFNILFKLPIEERWQKAAMLLGIDINQLSGHVGHA